VFPVVVYVSRRMCNGEDMFCRVRIESEVRGSTVVVSFCGCFVVLPFVLRNSGVRCYQKSE